MVMTDLAGRNGLVTGASSGIGQPAARRITGCMIEAAGSRL
jgi:NAD(P)-dependent dehydrogenase (short-subunit alcohol dehydrogenase family)